MGAGEGKGRTHLGLLLRDDLLEGENLHVLALDGFFELCGAEGGLALRVQTRDGLGET